MSPATATPARSAALSTRRERVEAVVGQDLLQPLGRALAVGGEQRPVPAATSSRRWPTMASNRLMRAVGALGREVARRAAAEVA